MRICRGVEQNMFEQMAVEIGKRGDVVFINMREAYNQNKLTVDMMQQLMQALDEAESYEDVRCLVTIGVGKFYSAGLDINTEIPLNQNCRQIAHDMGVLHMLLARLLTFPLPTIAAINGHAFGGGAFLTLAHDYRIMRRDRGWWCVPAATAGLQIPLPNGLIALLRTKVPVSTLSQAILARRYGGEEAEQAGIVHEVCSATEMAARAAAAAERLTRSGQKYLDRRTLATLKQDLYREAYTTLSDGISYSWKSKL